MAIDFREKIFNNVKGLLDEFNLTKEELLFIYDEVVVFKERIQSFPERPLPNRSSTNENDSRTLIE